MNAHAIANPQHPLGKTTSPASGSPRNPGALGAPGASRASAPPQTPGASALTGPHDTLSPDTRRSKIVHILDRLGEQSIDQLALQFDVSGMTIRRDLAELAASGQVLRTHGGASPAARVNFEFKFLDRNKEQSHAKAQIAQIAASLVKPGDTVMLDSSTTTLAIAKALKPINNITVITTSLPIASQLFGLDHIQVLLLGGILRKDSPDLIGAITDHCLDVLHGDIAFIGADAIDLRGNIYNASTALGQMLKRMSAAAKQVYAVADHTKINTQSMMRFANVGNWQGLITDGQLNPQHQTQLKTAGINLLVGQTAVDAQNPGENAHD